MRTALGFDATSLSAPTRKRCVDHTQKSVQHQHHIAHTGTHSGVSLTHSLTHALMTDGRSNGKIVTVATLLLTPSATWWSQGRRGDTSRPRRRSRGRQTQWARRRSQWRHGGTECRPGTRRTEGLCDADLLLTEPANVLEAPRTRIAKRPAPSQWHVGVVSADAPLLALGVDVHPS